jgi:hypothetical protein
VSCGSLGAAILAGRGAGVLPGEQADWTVRGGPGRPATGVRPDDVRRRSYDLLYEHWRAGRG